MKYNSGIIGIILLVLSSCVSIEPLALSKVESVQLENFQSGELTLKLKAKIKNPNGFKFKFKDERLDLFINGREIGQASVREPIVIKRHSDDVHEFFLTATLPKLTFAGILGLVGAFRDKAVDCQIKGDIRLRTLIFNKKYPVDIKERIDFNLLGKGFRD